MIAILSSPVSRHCFAPELFKVVLNCKAADELHRETKLAYPNNVHESDAFGSFLGATITDA
jgi:hypothetical protein